MAACMWICCSLSWRAAFPGAGAHFSTTGITWLRIGGWLPEGVRKLRTPQLSASELAARADSTLTKYTVPGRRLLSLTSCLAVPVDGASANCAKLFLSVPYQTRLSEGALVFQVIMAE